MRRRFTAAVISEQMERGNGKNQNNRLCVLTTLCVLFWSLLLYFHFVVLGSRPGDDPSLLQSNSIRIEPRPTNVPFSNDVQLKSDPFETRGTNNLGTNPDETGGSSGDPGETNVVAFQSDRKINAGSKPTKPSPEKVEPRDEPSPQNVEPRDEPKPRIVEPNDEPSIEKVEAKDDPNPQLVEPRDEPSTEKVEAKDDPNPQLVEPRDEPSTEKVEAKDEPSPQKVEPKDEKEEFLFMKALKTAENKSDPCGGRYIYVHDLPSRFNEDMLKECRSLSLWTNMCKFIINDGLGPPLENVDGVFSTTGWYATNQFAVDVIFNNRMKQYECLTNDSSLAAAVFVPFYAGFDIARYLWGYNITMRDAASLDLVDWLMKRPEWKIMDGRDHFLVAGRITWDFRRLSEEETDWGSKLLFLPAAKNMSMLVVESSPWNANDFAIPYPTYFHPAKDADVFVWQDRMRNLERPYLFSFAGAPRPGNPKSIRGQLIDQCKNSKVCKLLECDFGESKCHSPSSIMKMFQSSLFCLQPQGDSYTRRSAFDSMLAGCIPVFFHPGSAYTQYTWHLPKNYTTYSVFIPENEVRKGMVNIEETLKRIPPEQVKVMRETVISLIPNLIYADPRSKLETLQDAFDVSVRAIIDKVTRLRKNIIQGRTEYDDFIEENSWKYALLEDGQREVGAHPWDPFFSKPKEGEEDFNGGSTTNAEAAKNSWKNEQRDH